MIKTRLVAMEFACALVFCKRAHMGLFFAALASRFSWNVMCGLAQRSMCKHFGIFAKWENATA